MIYVCDRCGTQDTGDIGGSKYVCAKCGSQAGWEFPQDRERAAAHQSARIADRMVETRSFALLNDGRMRS